MGTIVINITFLTFTSGCSEPDPLDYICDCPNCNGIRRSQPAQRRIERPSGEFVGYPPGTKITYVCPCDRNSCDPTDNCYNCTCRETTLELNCEVDTDFFGNPVPGSVPRWRKTAPPPPGNPPISPRLPESPYCPDYTRTSRYIQYQ